jgi:hypothetical protein
LLIFVMAAQGSACVLACDAIHASQRLALLFGAIKPTDSGCRHRGIARF